MDYQALYQQKLTAAAEAFVCVQLERGFSTLDFYKTIG